MRAGLGGCCLGCSMRLTDWIDGFNCSFHDHAYRLTDERAKYFVSTAQDYAPQLVAATERGVLNDPRGSLDVTLAGQIRAILTDSLTN